MSKSWKRVYAAGDYSRHFTHIAKRKANQAVRRYEDVPDGMMYKRVYDSWDIHDYIYVTFSDEPDDSWFHPEHWYQTVGRNVNRKKRFPRYWRRDRKRARNYKRHMEG